jgi:hypothetical protein
MGRDETRCLLVRVVRLRFFDLHCDWARDILGTELLSVPSSQLGSYLTFGLAGARTNYWSLGGGHYLLI